MAAAGACYALLGTRWRDSSVLGSPLVRSIIWPWNDEWFKPTEYPEPPYHVAPPGMPFDGAPVPQAFTDDGQAVGVTVPTSSPTTDAVPYRVSLSGHGATLLFSSSVRSYGNLTRSPDGSHTWVAAGWTCSSIYRFPLMSIAGEDPWASPWRVG